LGGEVINVATGIAPRVRTVARAIGRMTGRLDLLKFGELPERQNDIINLRGDARKAQRLLGWCPAISLARGLASTIDWHRSALDRGCAA
jgi:nucleoside-diphosphate-sugar epimerase